eukprot:scaffold21815_cov157-Skeletonema_dohrnii-CCMP3373.AAC.2
MLLTTSQFTDTLARHIDESKPDQLAKSQIENLGINWEQEQLDGGVDDDSGVAGTTTSSLRGTLTLSSEYISVSIHVLCNWKKTNQSGQNDEQSCDAGNHNDGVDAAVAKQFQEEFFIKLTASATESSTVAPKDAKEQDRKERKASKKLRAEMFKRLRSDYYIGKLFGDDKANNDCVPLCEALIQQNLSSSDRSGGTNNVDELEERVNVEDGTLQGIKNAIFSQSEDNLDVLEILLNMPYLPRSSSPSSDNDRGDAVLNQWSSKLADRAYLRLLEDAMFDSCEKEGEDELLDDLNISGSNHYQHKAAAANSGGEGSGRDESSKRMRKNPQKSL